MTELFIILALVLLNGVFAMSEIALISTRKSSLSSEVRKGNKSAKVALKLAQEPDRFLSTVQIGITLIGILTGIYSGNTLAKELAVILTGCGIPVVYASVVAQAVIVIVVTYMTLIFGELVPKRIGLSSAKRVSLYMARPMLGLSIAASPFVWLLAKSTSLIFNLLGIKSSENKVTEEEIKSIIKEGTQEGEVQPMEQNIVARVFMMGDLKVSSIMTHKNEIAWLDIQLTSGQIKEVISEHLYEVYPVVEGNMDKVKGVVFLKDLILNLEKKDFKLDTVVRTAHFFHENMPVYKVLEQMKVLNISRALVCDEFGACQGIITLKDILEGLVGNMDDAPCEPEIVKRKDKEEWLVDGQCSFYDFLCYFNLEEYNEETEYNTVAGLLLDKLQRVPVSGDSLQWKGLRFEVVDMDGARIDKIAVAKELEM